MDRGRVPRGTNFNTKGEYKMLPGYNKRFNGPALRMLTPTVDIPDIRLGVGLAENMAPYDLKIPMLPPPTKPVIQLPTEINATTPVGKAIQLNMAMFPADGWLGSEYGGY